jgi:hypothetical protein
MSVAVTEAPTTILLEVSRARTILPVTDSRSFSSRAGATAGPMPAAVAQKNASSSESVSSGTCSAG